jgi:hypothetical protein
MGDKREIYKRVGENDWVLTEMKDLVVGDIISIHDDGKFMGLCKVAGPPYITSEGLWTVSVDKIDPDTIKEVKEGV